MLRRGDKEASTLVLIIAVAIIIGTAAVGVWLLLKGGPSTPEGTIRAFYQAFNDQNPDEAYRLFSDKIRSEHSKSEMETYIEIPGTYDVKVTEWSILSENRVDNRARIVVRSTYASKAQNVEVIENIPLVLADDRWLIDEWPTEWVKE